MESFPCRVNKNLNIIFNSQFIEVNPSFLQPMGITLFEDFH